MDKKKLLKSLDKMECYIMNGTIEGEKEWEYTSESNDSLPLSSLAL